ncbi:hypothetical protein MPSEU_000193400 [Mayamaea pseudoterrestris]|nr:hypothetical protein MPSEU_000193400 [Mayamaea pseudoterrestris]
MNTLEPPSSRHTKGTDRLAPASGSSAGRVKIGDYLATDQKRQNDDEVTLLSGSSRSKVSQAKPKGSVKTIASISSALNSLNLRSLPAKSTSFFKGKKDANNTTNPNSYDIRLDDPSSETVFEASASKNELDRDDEEREEEDHEEDGKGALILRDRSRELSKGRQRLRKSRTVKPASRKVRRDVSLDPTTKSDTNLTDSAESVIWKEPSELPLDWASQAIKRRSRQAAKNHRRRQASGSDDKDTDQERRWRRRGACA